MAGAGRGTETGRRAWAWLALALLAVLSVSSLIALAFAFADLAVLGVTALLNSVVLVAAGWWALTSRRTWKRRLNLAVAVLAAALLALDLLWFGLARNLWLVGFVLLIAAYVGSARRALARAPDLPRTTRPQRPWLLVNPRSGDGRGKTDLVRAAHERGVTVHLLAPGEDVAALARAAVDGGADAIGMAGGDGSMAAVAAVAAEHDVAFVCVPAGTRNHFAGDLGLDRRSPLAALDAYDAPDAWERRVDLAAVGDRVFVNNVSLGAYADLVHEPGYREGKLATARARLPAAMHGDPVREPLTVRDPAGRVHSGPLVLMVANNAYDVGRPLQQSGRGRLDTGLLQVTALYPATDQGATLVRVVSDLAAGRTPDAAQYTGWTSASVRVEAPGTTVRAGVDGEAAELPAPLRFRSLPAALRVRQPRATGVHRETRLLSRAALGRVWTLARRGTS